MAVGTRDDQVSPDRPRDKAGVFVSYAREDQGIVERLAAALRADGREVWIDTDDIRGTEEWARAVDAGIESSDAVAFVLSPAFVESEQCNRELEHALLNGKRLVPLLARAVDPAVVHSELARLNWIKIGDDGAAGVAALEEALDTDLDWVRAHTDLLVRAVAWEARREDRGLLLRGRPLADAEGFLANASRKDPPPAPLQVRYVLAGRRAATRRQRGTIAVVTMFLVVAVALALIALVQRNRALHQSNVATSRELAGSSTAVASSDPELARLLAIAAMDREQTPEAVAALRQAVTQPVLRVETRAEVVGLSPDGRRVAVREADHTLVIRDLASGRRVASSRVPGDAPVDLDRGGTRVAYSTAGGDVVLQDLLHKRSQRLKGPAEGLAFSPDGSKLLLFHAGSVAVVDARLGGRRITLPAYTGEASRFASRQAAFAPRGDLVVTWNNRSPTARVWDARTGALRSTLRHGANVTTAAISADGRRVLTAGRDMTVRFWDQMTGARQGSGIRVPPARDDPFDVDIDAASFSPNSSDLVATATEDHLQVWQAHDATLRLNLDTHFPSHGRFGPSAPYLLTGSGIRDWVHNRKVVELRMGVSLLQGDGSFESIERVGDQTRIWSGQTESTLIDLPRTASDVSSASGRVAVGYTDGTAEVRDASSRRMVLRVPRNRPERVGVELSPDGRTLAVARRAGVELWAVGRSKRRQLDASVTAVVGFSADATLLLAFASKGAGVYEVLDTRTGERIGKTFPPRTVQVDSAALSPDGRVFAQPTADNTVDVFRVADGGRVSRPLRGLSNSVADLAFSPDGKLVASGGFDGRVTIWDLDSGRRVATLSSHRAEVTRVAFSPDGRWLLTRSADGTLRVLEARTGAPVAAWTDLPKGLPRPGEIDVPAIPDLGLDFSASSDALLRADDAYVYRIPCPACADPDGLLARAKRETRRSLTPTERRQYLHER